MNYNLLLIEVNNTSCCNRETATTRALRSSLHRRNYCNPVKATCPNRYQQKAAGKCYNPKCKLLTLTRYVDTSTLAYGSCRISVG